MVGKVIRWLVLELIKQSVHITTKIVSSIPSHGWRGLLDTILSLSVTDGRSVVTPVTATNKTYDHDATGI